MNLLILCFLCFFTVVPAIVLFILIMNTILHTWFIGNKLWPKQVKLCKDCKWLDGDLCTNMRLPLNKWKNKEMVNLKTGEIIAPKFVPWNTARIFSYECGKAGKYWERKGV